MKDDHLLDVACGLIRKHRSMAVTFWLAPDFTQTFGAFAKAREDGALVVRVSNLGLGGLTPHHPN